MGSSPLYELNQWNEIVKSESWLVFKRLLNVHKQWLQKEVNGHLRRHEDRLAGELLARIDECDKILKLVDERVKKLTQKADEEKQ